MPLIKPAFAITNPIVTNSATHLADPESFFSNAIQAVLTFFLIVGVIYFMWHIVFATYHFMSTQGDKGKYESAKTELTQAVMGLFILFSIFALLRLVGELFGISGLDTLQLIWPTI